MSHVKLETARIIGQIQGTFSNREVLTVPTMTREDFEKSLGEGDKFFQSSEIEKFAHDVFKSAEAEGANKQEIFAKGQEQMKALIEYRIVDGADKYSVFVLKAQPQTAE
jgi:hypothetical protein